MILLDNCMPHYLSSYFVNRDGIIFAQHFGPIGIEQMNQIIQDEIMRE